MTQSHRARKRFGQNFLRDQNVIRAIVAAAQLEPDDKVVEIGPGHGALTHILAPAVKQMHLMEIDRDLAAAWDASTHAGVVVYTGDALQLKWEEFLCDPPYKLVANLPYNISSQILFKVIEHRELFSALVLMFQKEVAQRLRAQAGTKNYGILTVLCQLWFDVESVISVAPQAFTPQPKVDSEVLRFTRLEQARAQVDDSRLFIRVVKAAFAQRRKTLRNTLQSQGFDATAVDAAAAQTDIDLKRRGETLDLAEFAALSNALNQLGYST
ncbi:MAG: 16S rRNA (adenine(1518)-N(6)/adenine(1519)-N(6))-dimethyltransferase RsmA [Desulfuromonadaceae bacterium]|nr:16S rRNA (adenine(1518)-N(6)/adenine(1519)-N(6))-dimethyltransferase RsmA [Geobacteraceae bacterium]